MDSPRSSQSSRLESWKEIARHLNRTVRTVQRWEREQALPVHRLQHNKQATIFAYASELDEWWESRRQAIESGGEAPDTAPPQKARAVAFEHWRLVGAVIVVAFVAVSWISLEAIYRPRESDRFYALGRQHWNERSRTGFQAALRDFQASIAADRSNARAYAGLADTYSLLEAFGDLPRAEALPSARAAAARAVQLGDDLGEPHASLSFVLWSEGDREGAFREIERAIALDDKYATSFHWYALYLQDSGRYPEAVDAARRARALAPESSIIATDLAIVLRNAGRTAESASLLEEVARKQPDFNEAHLQLAETYRLDRQYEKAARAITRAVQNGDARPSTQARRAWLYAQTGDLRFAADTLTRFQMMRKQGEYVSPAALLEAVVAAGDLDFAFRILEQGVRDHEPWLATSAGGEVFKVLTGDPRWQALQPRVAALMTDPVRNAFPVADTTK